MSRILKESRIRGASQGDAGWMEERTYDEGQIQPVDD